MWAEGGRAVRDRLQRMLVDDRVFRGVQRGLRASQDARRRLDRNLLRALALMNLPAHHDVARIDEQVALLEEDVARLAGRLAGLAARLESSRDES